MYYIIEIVQRNSAIFKKFHSYTLNTDNNFNKIDLEYEFLQHGNYSIKINKSWEVNFVFS